MVVRTLFAMSDLLHLVETDLDRGFAAEDGYQHSEASAVLVDLGDLAGEVRERPGDHLDGLADRELSACARSLGRLAVEQSIDLRLRERDGLVGGADEAGDTGRALHQRPRV